MYLESKTNFFYIKHTEYSDEGELLDITKNASETKGNYDQNLLMLDIEKVLRDGEMDRENELQTHEGCEGCERVVLWRFLKAFRKT